MIMAYLFSFWTCRGGKPQLNRAIAEKMGVSLNVAREISDVFIEDGALQPCPGGYCLYVSSGKDLLKKMQ